MQTKKKSLFELQEELIKIELNIPNGKNTYEAQQIREQIKNIK